MKTFLTAFLLTALPIAASADCAAKHQTAAMSCAEGMTYDAGSKTCIPVTG